MTSTRILAAALALAATPALSDEPAGGVMSEVKVGVLRHDIDLLSFSREGGQALNGEVLFRSPVALAVIGKPRPHLGGTAALKGRTDQIYAGLTWTARPFGAGFRPLWLSAFFGGAVHDGERRTANPDRKSLGSPVLFRFGAEVGWDVSRRVSVSAHYAHVSNAYLADRNEGLDQAGIRIGWRF